MLYEPFKMPFSTPVHRMDLEQLKSYAEWFAKALPDRVRMLVAEVRRTPAYENWKPDFTLASLEGLGQWFCERIRGLPLRPQTTEEIRESLKVWFFENITPELHGSTPEALFADFQNEWIKKIGSNSDPERPALTAMEWFYRHSKVLRDFLRYENQWQNITQSRRLNTICFSYFADVGMYFSRTFAHYIRNNFPHIKWYRSFGSLKYRHYHPQNGSTVDFNPITAITEVGFDMYEGKCEGNGLKNLFLLWADCIALYDKQLPLLAELARAGIPVKSVWDFKYQENPDRRKSFAKAAPILCKHLKEQCEPYILEAVATGLLENELKSELASDIASEMLKTSSSEMTQSLRALLLLLAKAKK